MAEALRWIDANTPPDVTFVTMPEGRHGGGSLKPTLTPADT